MRTYRNFIDGRLVGSKPDSQPDLYADVDNPATAEIIARVTLASRDDALSAVEAASRAQKKWRALTAIERGEHLRRFADASASRRSPRTTNKAASSACSTADAA